MSAEDFQTYFHSDSFAPLPVDVLKGAYDECLTWRDDYGRVDAVQASIAQEIALHKDTPADEQRAYADINAALAKRSTTPTSEIGKAFVPLYLPGEIERSEDMLTERLLRAASNTIRRSMVEQTPQMVGAVGEVATHLVLNGMHADGLFAWPSYYRQDDNLMQIPYDGGRKLWDINIESNGTAVAPGRYLAQVKITTNGQSGRKQAYHKPIIKVSSAKLFGFTSAERQPDKLGKCVGTSIRSILSIDHESNVVITPTRQMRDYVLSVLDGTEPLDNDRNFI